MNRLLDRVTSLYDDFFMEVVYRAHHGSYKVSFADVFHNDFVDYIVDACGLRKRAFWKFLPEISTLKYMYEIRRKFLHHLKNPREKWKNHMTGEIEPQLGFWLSQLSFWYGTVKAFAKVWASVSLDEEDIPNDVDWDEAITLYIISDFSQAARNSNYKAVRKQWTDKYKQYTELERKSLKPK